VAWRPAVREIEVVRGEEDGAPGRRPFADELKHVVLAEGIESARRLVQDQELRVVHVNKRFPDEYVRYASACRVSFPASGVHRRSH
jgi:hypothetical protein